MAEVSGGGSICRMRKVFIHSYDSIISIENLLLAWQEFLKGKKNRKDVQEFEQRLMKNIVELHLDLKEKTYKHSEYQALISQTQNLEIFIKLRLEIDYFITLFIEFFIHFLIKFLLVIHILAD